MAKASGDAGRDWRSRMVDGLKAARAARNGGAGGAARTRLDLLQTLALWLLGLVFFAGALAILEHGAPPLAYRLGGRARTDVRARVTFAYEDPDAFNRRREELRNATPTIYEYKPRWAETLLLDVDRLIEARVKSATPQAFRKQLLDQKLIAENADGDKLYETLGAMKEGGEEQLRKKLRVPLLDRAKELDTYGVLTDERWDFERRRVSRFPLPSDPSPWRVRTGDEPEPVIVRLVQGKREKVPVDPSLSPWSRARSESSVREDLKRLISRGYDAALVPLLEKLVVSRVSPSLKYDKDLTEKAIAEGLAGLRPQQTPVREGSLLVRAGDLIGAKEMRLLRDENRAHWERQALSAPQVRMMRLGGLLVTLGVLLGVVVFWIWRTDPEVLGRSRQLAGLAVLGLAVLTTAKAAGELDWPVQVVPVVFFAMVAALVFPIRAAAALAMLCAALSAVALGAGFGSAPILGAGALAGALAGAKPRHRLDILKAALIAGLISAAATGGWRLLEEGEGSLDVLRGAGWGLGAALAQGLILAGALPVLESAFGTTTSISLLELCDQNHPLLKALFLNAPGSHQHSMIVGILSESAAEAIDADPLLARAGSYYHDIGKIARPEYFVENAPPGQNRHDRLGNSM
ncbi:MAG: HDIG domain-containing metalloprotein, partial [Planctomycetota bacterium]